MSKIDFIAQLIEQPIYIIWLFLFFEPFIALIFFMFYKKGIRILINSHKVKWDDIKKNLVRLFGYNYMLRVPKKNIYMEIKKFIRINRLKINLFKIISVIFVLLKVMIPFILHIPDDFIMVVFINMFSAFIYFIYVSFVFIEDRKINGDVISLKKNIKTHIFDNYVTKDEMDL